MTEIEVALRLLKGDSAQGCNMQAATTLLLTMSALSLACTSKSLTAPTAAAMPATLENPAGTGKQITILSGELTNVPGGSVNIALRGTSGLTIEGKDAPISYPWCAGCEPGTAIDVGLRLDSISGYVRVDGHEYQASSSANSRQALARLHLAGILSVPVWTASASAATSAPFTVQEGVVITPSANNASNTRWTLNGSGTAALTFSKGTYTPGIWWTGEPSTHYARTNSGTEGHWWINSVVFTFREMHE